MKNIIIKITLCIVLFFCVNTLTAQEYTFEDEKTVTTNNEIYGSFGLAVGSNVTNEEDDDILLGLYYAGKYNTWFGVQIEALFEYCFAWNKPIELHVPFLLQFSRKHFTLETGLILDRGIYRAEYDFTMGIPIGLKWKSNPFYVGKTANRIGLGLRYVFHFSERYYFYSGALNRQLNAGHNSLQLTLSWELGRKSWNLKNIIKNL
ncbi:MAG: hypothetical protein IJ213_03400 [Bacteroidales bacterium]|nr:hypothetical protein [Bacteroidales bacterium]